MFFVAEVGAVVVGEGEFYVGKVAGVGSDGAVEGVEGCD